MKTKSAYRGTAVGINRLAVLWLGLGLSLGWSGLAAADQLDQDQVLSLIKQGEILPLEALLQRHRQRLQGRLIDLELEREHGRLIYELELIDAQGVVREYMIDAKSGEWLDQE